eukprot:3803877-Amphidinium_carterae.1
MGWWTIQWRSSAVMPVASAAILGFKRPTAARNDVLLESSYAFCVVIEATFGGRAALAAPHFSRTLSIVA